MEKLLLLFIFCIIIVIIISLRKKYDAIFDGKRCIGTIVDIVPMRFNYRFQLYQYVILIGKTKYRSVGTIVFPTFAKRKIGRKIIVYRKPKYDDKQFGDKYVFKFSWFFEEVCLIIFVWSFLYLFMS